MHTFSSSLYQDRGTGINLKYTQPLIAAGEQTFFYNFYILLQVEDPGEKRSIMFDPRNSCDREPDYTKTLQHLQELKQLNPNCGI